MEPWILILVAVAVVVFAIVALRKKPAALSETTAHADAARPVAAKLTEGAPSKSEAKAEAKVESKTEAKTEAKGEDVPAKAEAIAKEAIAEAAAPVAKQEPTPTEAKAEEKPAVTAPAAAEPTAADRVSFRPDAPPKDDEAASLRKGLGATRTGFFGRLKDLFSRKAHLDPAALDEVEEILLSSDVGVATTANLLGALRTRFEAGELETSNSLRDALRDDAKRILRGGSGAIVIDKKPTVLLFVGVNGVGKTTTIGKLASRFKEDGKKVLLAAGDTYRAAAVIQLEAWSRRVGCDVLKGKDRADPSGVIFDAVKKGIDEGYDVVLCDTAGRLQTKMPLMDELGKIGRSVEKALGRNADETLLVLDATTGQNAIQQAAQFGSTLPLSGIVLTKLDGTAKGGVILGIVDEQKVPVRYVGIGERVEDLRAFDSDAFVEALFDPREEA